ncbi:MAG: RNA polymerase sigma factor [Ilumatobacter sp.]
MPLTGAAAARLYDDHVDAVHAMVARRVGPDLAPQVVGEAFEHAVRSWERFDVGRGTERLFLFGAASAVLRRHADAESDHIRSIRPAVTRSGVIHDPLVGGHAARRSNVVERNTDVADAADDVDTPERRLVHAIAALPPDDRDIVLLSLWESCSQSAIAEALDLSVGTVRSALGRIRRELKGAVSGDPS